VAQLVEHPTLGFSSGPNLRVRSSETYQAPCSVGSLLRILSLPLFAPPLLALSKINFFKNNELSDIVLSNWNALKYKGQVRSVQTQLILYLLILLYLPTSIKSATIYPSSLENLCVISYSLSSLTHLSNRSPRSKGSVPMSPLHACCSGLLSSLPCMAKVLTGFSDSSFPVLTYAVTILSTGVVKSLLCTPISAWAHLAPCISCSNSTELWAP